jgi:PAS domain S-box-containing protein
VGSVEARPKRIEVGRLLPGALSLLAGLLAGAGALLYPVDGALTGRAAVAAAALLAAGAGLWHMAAILRASPRADTSDPSGAEQVLGRETIYSAMANASLGLIVYDAEDRLIFATPYIRERFAALSDPQATAGKSFAALVTETAHQGLFKPPPGQTVEEFLARLIAWHEAPDQPFDVALSDGRTVRFTDLRLENGWTVGLRQDVSEAKRTERELTESRTRLREMASAAADWFWETDAEGRYTYFSRDFSPLFRVATAELIGLRRIDLIRDRNAPEVRAHLADLEARRPFRNFRFEATFPTGTKRTLSVSGQPILDEDGIFQGYRGATQDLTDELRAERAAEAAESRLASAIEAMNAAIELYDKDNHLVLFNSRMIELYSPVAVEIAKGAGYEAITARIVEAGLIEQAVGREEEWLEADIARHRAGDGARDLRQVGDTWLQVRAHRLPDGGRLVIQTDVTVMQAHAQRAQAQSSLLMSTFNAMIQAIAVFDRDLRLRACNKRLIDLFDLPPDLAEPGTPIESLIRRNFERGWLPVAAEDLEDKVRDRLAIYRARAFHREELHPSDGRVIEMQLHPDDQGGMVVTYTDITKRRTAERALLKAKEEAEIANHAKSQFLASMTHELRTPLNAIIGFAEVLREEIYGPLGTRQYREFANDIFEGGQHLLSMINDILDLSKIEAGRRELVNESVALPSLVESVVRMVRQRASEAGVRLEREIPDDLPLIHAEDKSVRQMLINLVSNAIKFTPKGGRAVLRAALEPDGGLTLSVADNGIGMASHDIPIALAPFQQIDSALSRRYQGTGLGLPLVNSLIELHGGRLEIDSAPDEGTTMTLHFPAERVLGPDRTQVSERGK